MPCHFEPADFGAHGQHTANLTHETFGDQMQAMLATLKANDLSQFDTDAILEDLSDTLTLKAALTGPEKDHGCMLFIVN